MPEATKSTSFIRARPWLEVAVNVLAPVAEEPRQALIAECSGLHRDIFGIELAVGYQLGEVLNYMGLGVMG